MIAKDEQSIASRLANEEKKSEDDARRTSTKGTKTREEKLAEKDPHNTSMLTLTYLSKLSNISGTRSCIE
jgi:hypothetical protein